MTFDPVKQPARRRGPNKSVTLKEAEMALSRLRMAAERGDPLACWAIISLSQKEASHA